MIGLLQSESARLLNLPVGTICGWRKRLRLPKALDSGAAQQQAWRASIYQWRPCITCHAAVSLLPAESSRLLGWKDRGPHVSRIRKRLGLWIPSPFDRARIPVVKAGRANQKDWGIGYKTRRGFCIKPKSSPQRWLHWAMHEEMFALKQHEQRVSWSKHPVVRSTMPQAKWRRVKTMTPQQRINEWQRNRYNTDQNYKMRCAIRGATSRIKRKLPLDCDSEQILGATIETVCCHLESQFTDGMSWANHGQWHIDHIMPLCKFDLTDPAQARIAGSYKNLRPLWGKLNLKKGGRWTEESQQLAELLRLEQGIFSN